MKNRAGYVISAIFICAEYQRLGMHFRQHRVLRGSFWLKLVFIIVEAVVFIATNFKNQSNIAAVFEWVIALIFTFYVLTFFIDLLPAWHDAQHSTNVEMGMVDGEGGAANRGEGAADYSRNEYAGAYEAQDRRAVPQPVPASRTDYGSPNSTMTSAYTNGTGTMDGGRGGGGSYANGGATGPAIEHAGPGYNKVQPGRNF
ncbi:MAG: hypothetical protein Q9191_000896 [Dirinaria sp. TL-2023a]